MTNNDAIVPLLFIFSALVVGALVRGLFRTDLLRGLIPYTVFLMIIGLIISVIVYHADTSEDRTAACGGHATFACSVNAFATIDPHLILHIFLPALIFESAFSINYHIFYRELPQSLTLAGPGVILAVGFTSLVAKYVFPYQWDWDVALMFGSIVSATDPVAVVAMLRDLGASKRLATLIEGESLLNDGTAFVFFVILKDSVLDEIGTPGHVIGTFFQLAGGAVALGLGAGILASFWISNVFNDARIETVVTIFITYLTFWIAEVVLHVSGVLAVVVLGLWLSRNRAVITPTVEEQLHHVWTMVGYIANTLVFIISGVIVGERMLNSDIVIADSSGNVIGGDDEQIGGKDIGYAILLFVFLNAIRMMVLYILTPALKYTGYGFNWKQRLVVMWSGLRGAVGLSLGLLVELEFKEKADELIEAKEFDQAIKLSQIGAKVIFHVAVTVFLSLFINGTTMKYLLSFLGMVGGEGGSRFFHQSVVHLKEKEGVLLRSLQQDEHYSGADWGIIRTVMPDFSGVIKETPDNEEDESSPLIAGLFRRAGFDVASSGSSRKSGGTSGDDGAEDEVKELSPDEQVDLVKQALMQRELAKRRGEALNDEKRRESLADLRLIMEREKDAADQDTANTVGTINNLETLTEVVHRNQNALVQGTLNERRKVLSFLEKELARARERLDNEERLTRDFKHRLLSSMRASYWKQFEEGMITQRAVSELVEAAETALDSDRVQDMYDIIHRYLEVPWFLENVLPQFCGGTVEAQLTRTVLGSEMLGSLMQSISRRVLYAHLSFGVELATGYLTAHEAIDELLTNFDSNDDREQQLLADVRTEFFKYAELLRHEWLEIQRSYPEVYRNIQTRNAIQYMLLSTKHSIHQLYVSGLLEEQERSKMAGLVDERIHQVVQGRMFASQLASGSKIIYELPFLVHLSNKARKTIVEKCQPRVFRPGSALYTSGQASEGIYVITRGLVNIIIAGGKVVDTLSIGRMIGTYSMLSNRVYMAEARAKSFVEAFWFSKALILTIMKDATAEQRIWKMAGSTLIKAFFQDKFMGFSSVQMAQLCDESMYIKMDNRPPLMELHSIALLLTGKVKHCLVESASNVPSVVNSPITANRRLSLSQSSTSDDSPLATISVQQVRDEDSSLLAPSLHTPVRNHERSRSRAAGHGPSQTRSHVHILEDSHSQSESRTNHERHNEEIGNHISGDSDHHADVLHPAARRPAYNITLDDHSEHSGEDDNEQTPQQSGRTSATSGNRTPTHHHVAAVSRSGSAFGHNSRRSTPQLSVDTHSANQAYHSRNLQSRDLSPSISRTAGKDATEVGNLLMPSVHVPSSRRRNRRRTSTGSSLALGAAGSGTELTDVDEDSKHGLVSSPSPNLEESSVELTRPPSRQVHQMTVSIARPLGAGDLCVDVDVDEHGHITGAASDDEVHEHSSESESDSDEESTIGVMVVDAPCMLYPSQEFMDYQFSAGTRLLIFRLSEALRQQVERHLAVGMMQEVTGAALGNTTPLARSATNGAMPTQLILSTQTTETAALGSPLRAARAPGSSDMAPLIIDGQEEKKAWTISTGPNGAVAGHPRAPLMKRGVSDPISSPGRGMSSQPLVASMSPRGAVNISPGHTGGTDLLRPALGRTQTVPATLSPARTQADGQTAFSSSPMMRNRTLNSNVFAPSSKFSSMMKIASSRRPRILDDMKRRNQAAAAREDTLLLQAHSQHSSSKVDTSLGEQNNAKPTGRPRAHSLDDTASSPERHHHQLLHQMTIDQELEQYHSRQAALHQRVNDSFGAPLLGSDSPTDEKSSSVAEAAPVAAAAAPAGSSRFVFGVNKSSVANRADSRTGTYPARSPDSTDIESDTAAISRNTHSSSAHPVPASSDDDGMYGDDETEHHNASSANNSPDIPEETKQSANGSSNGQMAYALQQATTGAPTLDAPDMDDLPQPEHQRSKSSSSTSSNSNSRKKKRARRRRSPRKTPSSISLTESTHNGDTDDGAYSVDTTTTP
jgi:NhaP-type Na+/H+ or K+/H+ antiporter